MSCSQSTYFVPRPGNAVVNKTDTIRTSLRSSGQDSELLLQRAWVRSLVRELRSCMLCGMGKKTKTTSKKKKRKKKTDTISAPKKFPPYGGQAKQSNTCTVLQSGKYCRKNALKGFGNLGGGGTKEQGFRLPGARQDVPPEELASTEAQR